MTAELITCPHCQHDLAPPCPHCFSHKVSFNGRQKKRRQCLCRDCGKQFVAGARNRITQDTWNTVDVLLQAMVEVSVIHKAVGISQRHLYSRRDKLGIC